MVPDETIGQNLCKGHPCVKDDDPNRAANYNQGFCDCYSGWSGMQCETKDIGTSDILPEVEEKNGVFTPEIPVLEAQDGNSPIFAVTVTIPSRQSPKHNPNNLGSVEGTTRLSFRPPVIPAPVVVPTGKRNDDLVLVSKRAGVVNPNACNYPNNANWALKTSKDASKGWLDSYHNTFSYSQLANCGLKYVRSDENFAYFNTTLVIERNFALGNGRFSFDRKFSVDKVISIEFPRNLAVSSNVVVSNNTVEFYGALTELTFNPVDQIWSITIGTAINKPFYKLELAQQVANPHPASPVRDWISVGGDSIVDCPGDYTKDCKQQWKFQTHSCDALSINALKMKFNVVCVSGTTPDAPKECAKPNPEVINAEFSITTISACPKSQEFKIPEVGKELKSYSSNTYTTAKELFGISETMFLAVDFVAPPANISRIKVTALCAYPQFTNLASVPASCPSERSVLTTDITQESPADYHGHKVAFNIIAGKLKAASGVAEATNKITVQVQLELEYDGQIIGNKRLSPSTQLFSLSTDLLIEDEKIIQVEINHDKSTASSTTVGLFAVLALIALLF